MSFSNDVKNEISKIRVTGEKNRKLLLYGMAFGGKRGYDADNEIVLGGGDRETGIFLRGVFLSCGNVSAPDKNYHLELNISDEKKRDALFTLITESGIAIKKGARKNRALLYIKDSESISDFLTFIGAGVNSMEVMNAKIFKEVRNNVNRAVNCDAANIDKTAKAAGKQAADIELIYQIKGKKFLPPELRQIAELRLKNLDMSLKEIGEACEPRLSRSGVFHRLEKIRIIAAKLREE